MRRCDLARRTNFEYADAVRALQQRQPDPVPGLIGDFLRLPGGVGPPGHGRIHSERLAVGRRGNDELHQTRLRVVDDKDLGLSPDRVLQGPLHAVGDLVRAHSAHHVGEQLDPVHCRLLRVRQAGAWYRSRDHFQLTVAIRGLLGPSVRRGLTLSSSAAIDFTCWSGQG